MLRSEKRKDGYLQEAMTQYRKRKCADTSIGIVPAPWAGHFQC